MPSDRVEPSSVGTKQALRILLSKTSAFREQEQNIQTRIINVLVRENIDTNEKLLAISSERLHCMKGLAQKCITVLEAVQAELRGERPPEETYSIPLTNGQWIYVVDGLDQLNDDPRPRRMNAKQQEAIRALQEKICKSMARKLREPGVPPLKMSDIRRALKGGPLRMPPDE